jgi:DNA-binding transcriptional regulator GbsR (MarR family)
MDKVVDLYEKKYKEYALAIIDIEIELHKSRSLMMNGKISNYFNSTQNRNTFARIMSKAYMTNKPYSITEVCELLSANRSSVSIMVDECEKEGWITVLRDKNKAMCMATEEVYEAMMRYVYWRKQNSKSIIGDHYKAIDQLESVLNHVGVDIPDMTFGEKEVEDDDSIK